MNPPVERLTNKTIFAFSSTIATLSLMAASFVPNIYLLAITYGMATIALGVMFNLVIGNHVRFIMVLRS